MSQLNKGLITEKGLNLIAKSQAGAKIQFTKFAAGDGQWAQGTDFLKVTALKAQKQTFDINSIVVLNMDTVRVRGVLTNTGLYSGYFIREIGLFANDPDLGEILYSIVTAVTADYFPAFSDNNQQATLIDTITTVSNADSVLTVLNPDTVYGTAQDIIEVRAGLAALEEEALSAGGMAVVISQQMLQHKRAIDDLDGEIQVVSLTNNQEYPFNNSIKTVGISRVRDTLNYRVTAELNSLSGGFLGNIKVSEKALNGFKIEHTGSAKNVELKLYIQGGINR